MDIIKRLAESDPTYESGMGDIYCVFCGPLEYAKGGESVHSPDCPWLESKRLIETDIRETVGRFSLDDTDDGEFYSLEVRFIEEDVIMFTVMDKESQKEIHTISVVYSDLIDGVSKLRRPALDV